MSDDDKMRRLRRLSRQRMRIVWEIANLDTSVLNNDDRLLAEAMRAHPEYHELWSRLDKVTDYIQSRRR